MKSNWFKLKSNGNQLKSNWFQLILNWIDQLTHYWESGSLNFSSKQLFGGGGAHTLIRISHYIYIFKYACINTHIYIYVHSVIICIYIYIYWLYENIYIWGVCKMLVPESGRNSQSGWGPPCSEYISQTSSFFFGNCSTK